MAPVLDDLRQKFHEIVLSHLFLWRGESLESVINFNQESCSISAICDLVGSSDFARAAMPDRLVDLLHIEARGQVTCSLWISLMAQVQIRPPSHQVPPGKLPIKTTGGRATVFDAAF